MNDMRRPFRIGMPAAASLLVNALLIAALLNLGMGRQARRAEGPSLTVMSLALLKGVEDGAENAESSAPSPAEKRPDPAPPQPEAVQAAAPLPPPPIIIPSALQMPASQQVARPSPAAPAPAATRSAASAAAASAAAAPAASAPAARRGVADGLDANAPAGNSRSYAAKVRSWLYAHKVYPKHARMRREEGMVRIHFVLDRAGILLEGHIVGSSGHASLDQEAMAMMQRASPYPRAPGDIPGERIEFTAPVEFTLPT